MVFQTYLTLLVLDDDDRRMRFINGDVNGVYQYGGVQDGNGGVQDGNGGVQNGNGGVQYRNGGGGAHCGRYYCTHGSCQYTNMNGVETHSCTCSQGWHGEHCDQTDHVTSFHANDCTNHQCFHGHCERDVYNNEHCKCKDGWTGYQCHINVAQTAKPDTLTVYNYDQECHFHGYWTQSGCLCDDHWSGNRCEYLPTTTTTSTTSKPNTMMVKNNHYDQVCNDHGYWIRHSGCQCHENWSGDRCQYPPGSGQQDHCLNHCGEHGTCTRHQSHHGNEYWNCKCDHGWHGDHCTFQYIVTHSTHCHNTYCVNGDCTYYQDTMGHKWGYHCRCHHDWEGDHCDQEKTSMYP
ncbi:protein jagged-1-like isoform X2 [Ruditapes philippinarum]|uniref:protein jagged-1-like isoform X2 n=1 Tax=Ruditapes philippinarum TaxID=129788 RepID=UPI00295B8E38|nr:protein jagged-1-like isoform X2 [Ruditapes philippinarum]